MIPFRCSMLLLFTFIQCGSPLPNESTRYVDEVRPKSTAEEQKLATLQLIKRTLPSKFNQFDVDISSSADNTGYFTLSSTTSGVLLITASDGVLASWGFNHFLKYYCNAHVSWSGNQLKIPDVFPRLSKPVTVKANRRFRYYQNVCTVSYSFAWWNWTRWEKEIDWMAMNGINLPLAFTAQEVIWHRVYTKLGLTNEELWLHFSGPAFYAWQRMGNLEGWGGPNSFSSWYNVQLALQHQILNRMRSFGMIPVLPGFAGHVPKAITRLYPDAKVTTLGDWCNFPKQYCCTLFLDPLESLFKKIGSMFIEEQMREYNGTDHIYNCDPFNEMNPSSRDIGYIANVSSSIFNAMATSDEDAIWLMQGWLFAYATSFWGQAQIKALLTGTPIGKMIVLDLYAEITPVWKRTHNFFGQPHIWCMLHNFGGNNDMYGAAQLTVDGILLALNQSENMIGSGLTPEGIHQNDVMYELMNEMGWRKEQFDRNQWALAYANRRYGSNNKHAGLAMQILMRSVYNSSGGWSRYPLPVNRPSLDVKVYFWYAPQDIHDAWRQLLNAADELATKETFRYDLVNVGRQVLQNLAWSLYQNILSGYNAGQVNKVQQFGDELVSLLLDMDALLSTDKNFLLGNWLESAKSFGVEGKRQRVLYEFNARNQITVWGPNGNILDYANKMWGGLIKDYYAKRWSLFVNTLVSDMTKGEKFDRSAFNTKLMMQDIKWTNQHNDYLPVPQGDAVATAKKLFQKYRSSMLDVESKVFKPHSQWIFDAKMKTSTPVNA